MARTWQESTPKASVSGAFARRPAGIRSGSYQPLWLLPALSGAEMVALLEQVGFLRLDARLDRTEMANREGALVRIPFVPVLRAEDIGEILKAARLSVVRLLELLDRTP